MKSQKCEAHDVSGQSYYSHLKATEKRDLQAPQAYPNLEIWTGSLKAPRRCAGGSSWFGGVGSGQAGGQGDRSLRPLYNGLIRIIVVVTGFVLQIILSIYTLKRIQYLQVFFWQRDGVDMLFLVVYTKMLGYYGWQIIYFFRSLFSIHEICILGAIDRARSDTG